MSQNLQDILKSGGLEALKKMARKRKERDGSASAEHSPLRSVTRCPDPQRVSFPLSNAQQSLWILDQYLDDRRAYNNPVAIRCEMKQPLDAAVMKRAFQFLIQRYDILRTTFHLQDGEIRQQVSAAIGTPFQYEDISHLSGPALDAYIRAQAKASCHQTFDLEKGPLLDYKLLGAGEKTYIILLTFHHIISDGWTVHVFFQRLMESYFQLLGGMTPAVSPDELQFTDYALAEAQWINDGAYQKELDFWQQRLAGASGRSALVTDHPRPQTMTTTGGQRSILLDHAFCQRMQSFAAHHQATVFHLILAAYQVMLHKYSGQNEVIVGVPFANRNHPATKEMPGLFMNTLPLRFDVKSRDTLLHVLEAAKKESEATAAHQDIPLNMILDAIHYQREPQVNPLYQAVLSYQVYPQARANPWFTFRPLKVDYGFAKVDLNLWVEEVDDDLLLTMNYNKALFEAHTIERMLTHLQMILQAMTDEPDCTIAGLSLLSEAEKQRYLEKRPSEQTPQLPVHQQFEQQVQQMPEATAVRCESRTLSYQALNHRANSVAHRLLAHGLQGGDRVAIVMDKSEHYLVAVLAVLKAGGCFVPVDLKLPVQRQQQMLAQAEVTVILTDGSAPETDIAQINCRECEDGHLQQSLPNPQVAIAPDALAYIMFTSGSTGTPKGVCIGHAQLSHYCQAIAPVLNQDAGARYGMFSAFTTDLAYTMVFPALTQQGVLEIITPAQLEDPQALQACLASEPLDCMKITPGHLGAFLAASGAEDFLPRKLLVLGGERLRRSLIETVRSLNPACRIVNHYGPTESAVGVCACEVPSSLPELWGDVLPVGQPLNGSEILLLDEAMQPVADGIPGEIYIGGPQLAQGYAGLTAQTAERFVPHPWAEQARLYRSGDKGRRLSDGSIAFLGRLDRQCKVRGFRVELAEIESAMHQIPGIAQAAVCQWPSPVDATESVLVAYWCGDETVQPMLEMKLQSVLPHYMQPDQLIRLPALPLGASGKVDYRQLPAPERAEENNTPAKVDLTSETAQTVSALYAQALNRSAVDPLASFMALGGNSIIALKLVIEINKAFGCSLSLGVFVQHSSVTAMSAWLDQQDQDKPEQPASLVQLREGPAGGPVFLLVHPAGGNVMCYNKLAEALGAECSVYGIQVAEFATTQDYNHDIAQLAAHYLKDAESVMHSPRLVIGGWSLGATIAFEMAAQFAERTGKSPDILVLDQPAPQARLDDALAMTESERLAYFAYKVGLFTGRKSHLSGDALAAMTELQQAACFLEEFRQAGLVPDNITAEHFRYFLRILRAHIAATDRYPGRPYPGRVVIAEAESLLEGRIRHAEPGLGWHTFTPQPVTVLPAQGNHISMMTSPYIEQLAATLRNVWL
ncbi:Linear gramicidin synthase subunit B [Vibrio aerogenes CECT 7868]|uniref:Linear gramicidin synthase subunit B n=1 Tax=Vibrio aerogenes CECT 7868 TaxID=1216006 RepID=A0A1M5ZTG2_9VIBR|nr:non-ribosomal peptide synthetase [Vibrio aerogenes]SHI27379.1 Linear gramicidin synthase subunit B [Vibrio aerogenes CECT 7868]